MRGLKRQLGFAASIVKGKLTGEYPPLQMQISLTNHCNLKCSYCYAMYPERPEPDLKTDEIKRLIDQMADCGTQRINLVGGEPLMRSDIGELIDHIKSHGIECAMTTNGYMIPHKIETIKNIDLICLSLDGDKEATDHNRAVGCYDRVIKAIQILQDRKITFQVSAVLNKKSIPSFIHVLEMGKKMGFSVGFTTLIEQTIDGKKQSAPDLPSDQEYREVLQQILDWKHQGYPVLFSDKVIEYARDWKHSYAVDKIMGTEPAHDYIRCNAGKFFGIMDVNGDVYPCPATVDVMPVKNAREVGFKEAFKNINHHNCKTCHIPCQNEFSRMYDFDVGVIRNILKNYKSAN